MVSNGRIDNNYLNEILIQITKRHFPFNGHSNYYAPVFFPLESLSCIVAIILILCISI